MIEKGFNHQLLTTQNFRSPYVWQPKIGFGHYRRKLNCWRLNWKGGM